MRQKICYRCHTTVFKDGHYLCFPGPVDTSQLDFERTQYQLAAGNAKIALEEGRNEKARRVIALRGKLKARYRSVTRTNKMTKGCGVEFDYEGWSAYGA